MTIFLILLLLHCWDVFEFELKGDIWKVSRTKLGPPVTPQALLSPPAQAPGCPPPFPLSHPKTPLGVYSKRPKTKSKGGPLCLLMSRKPIINYRLCHWLPLTPKTPRHALLLLWTGLRLHKWQHSFNYWSQLGFYKNSKPVLTCPWLVCSLQAIHDRSRELQTCLVF